MSSIESLAKEERIVKHSPRFAVVTDYKNLDISIKDLPNHYAFFLPLAGSKVYHSTNDNEADRNATAHMAHLALLQPHNSQTNDQKVHYSINNRIVT